MKNIIIFLLLLSYSVRACKISAIAEGNCADSANLTLGFCSGHVYEKMCIPINESEWNWTVYDKEIAVRDTYVIEVERILDLEVNGVGGQFSTNIECTNTLKSIICQMNFPYCENDTSYGVCGKGCDYLKSVCLTNINYCDLNQDVVGNSTNCTSDSLLIIATLSLPLLLI